MKVIIGRDKSSARLACLNGIRYSPGEIFLTSFLLFLCLLYPSPSLGGTNLALAKGTQIPQDLPKIPQQYGEVIYQSSGEKLKQLYIVGLEHRDSITRLNGANTPKVQAEVYKVGEWLILSKRLALLLPEGFFTRKRGKAVLSKSPEEMRTGEMKSLDFGDLEKRLADNSRYVNAEMLLKEYYGLRTRQIEDQGLYDAVHDAICKLPFNNNSTCDFLPLKSELDYLQQKRVAAMLQRIPEVIKEEFQHGNIENQRALFTIGISHVSGIIKYLNNKRIEIHSPLQSSRKHEEYTADLNLLKEQFGITVIVPKRLADNGEILKITGLDKFVDQYRRQPSSFSPKITP